MSKYTPGPWTFDPDEASVRGTTIRDACGGIVADNVEFNNAPLVAATPDLLEACKRHGICVRRCWLTAMESPRN